MKHCVLSRFDERAICGTKTDSVAEDESQVTCKKCLQVIREKRLAKAAPKMLEALRMFLQLNPTCHQGVTSCGTCAVCLGSQALAEAEGK